MEIFTTEARRHRDGILFLWASAKQTILIFLGRKDEVKENEFLHGGRR